MKKKTILESGLNKPPAFCPGSQNTICILGNGMVIDPVGIIDEIQCLDNNNIKLLVCMSIMITHNWA